MRVEKHRNNMNSVTLRESQIRKTADASSRKTTAIERTLAERNLHQSIYMLQTSEHVDADVRHKRDARDAISVRRSTFTS